MRLDLGTDEFVVADKRLKPFDYKRKGVAIYNASQDTFLCREFEADDECADSNCGRLEFAWKKDKLMLIPDETLSILSKNIFLRTTDQPILREDLLFKIPMTDFVWNHIDNCIIVNCMYFHADVYNRRGLIYALGQLVRGRGFPSSELIPESHREIFIDIDHIHTTPLTIFKREL